jgi:hypothetical protein
MTNSGNLPCCKVTDFWMFTPEIRTATFLVCSAGAPLLTTAVERTRTVLLHEPVEFRDNRRDNRRDMVVFSVGPLQMKGLLVILLALCACGVVLAVVPAAGSGSCMRPSLLFCIHDLMVRVVYAVGSAALRSSQGRAPRNTDAECAKKKGMCTTLSVCNRRGSQVSGVSCGGSTTGKP